MKWSKKVFNLMVNRSKFFLAVDNAMEPLSVNYEVLLEENAENETSYSARETL